MSKFDPIAATRMKPAIEGMMERTKALEDILEQYDTICDDYDDLSEKLGTEKLYMTDIWFRFDIGGGHTDEINIELDDEYPELREEIAGLVMKALHKKVETFMARVEKAKQAI